MSMSRSAVPTGFPSLGGSTSMESSRDFALARSHADNAQVAFSRSPGISGTGRNQKRYPDGVLDISLSTRLRFEVFIRTLKRDFDERATEK